MELVEVNGMMRSRDIPKKGNLGVLLRVSLYVLDTVVRPHRTTPLQHQMSKRWYDWAELCLLEGIIKLHRWKWNWQSRKEWRRGNLFPSGCHPPLKITGLINVMQVIKDLAVNKYFRCLLSIFIKQFLTKIKKE